MMGLEGGGQKPGKYGERSERRNFLRLEIKDSDNGADRKQRERRCGNEKLSRLR